MVSGSHSHRKVAEVVIVFTQLLAPYLAAGYSHIGSPWWFGTMEPIWSTIDALAKHTDGKGGHDECHNAFSIV